MRILIIHNHYKQAGGEDTVFFAEAALLEQYGHQVERLTFSNDHVNTLEEKLNAAVGVVYNPVSARIIKEKILAFKPDVIHVHNFFPLVSPAVFFVAHQFKVPIVMTLHNYRLVCPSALLYYNGQVQLENVDEIFPVKAIFRKVYRNSFFQTASVVLTTGIHKMLGTWGDKVDRYIALTKGAADLFQYSSLDLDLNKIVVKPNFTADLGRGYDTREPHYLYVGRLTKEKGIATLLQAHALNPFPLRIIGEGPLREAVEAHVAQYPSATYLGFQKKETVIEELKRAKALIFTSEWMETFGMTIIEAFSTGTPVIAAKIGGAEQLVQNSYNGLHYTPANAPELAAKVQQLEEEPLLLERLGQQAREDYESYYTPEANYAMLLQLYQEVIDQKEKPATTTEVSEASFIA